MMNGMMTGLVAVHQDDRSKPFNAAYCKSFKKESLVANTQKHLVFAPWGAYLTLQRRAYNGGYDA